MGQARLGKAPRGRSRQRAAITATATATAVRLAAGLAGGSLLLAAPAARAGLLGPLLQLMRPQLETRLAAACRQWASGGDAALAQRLQRPCSALAKPASQCLIEESERSGSSLAVISELAGGRFGASSEQVVKRCASRMLGLPPDSLQEVPLKDLAARFRRRPELPGADPAAGEPQSPLSAEP